MTADARPFLQVDDVSMIFRSKRQRVEALRHINLQVAPGEFVSIVGPSGCGKSTLLSLVAGLELPTRGRVVLGGQAVRGPSRLAGMVFQKDLLLGWRTALGNVLLQFEMRGIRVTGEHRRKALAALDSVGLGEFANSYPYELSGGMRQRVAICRAIVADPSLLLLDEPMGALDDITREKLNMDLAAISADTGATGLLVTHSIEEAVFLADRVLVMSARPGEVVKDIGVPVRRPRRTWPTSGSELGAYTTMVRDALQDSGAYETSK